MHNLTIRQPARITESQAQNVLFTAFRTVYRNPARRAEVLKGLSHAAEVDGFVASFFKDPRCGELKGLVYFAGALSPCASAIMDELDA